MAAAPRTRAGRSVWQGRVRIRVEASFGITPAGRSLALGCPECKPLPQPLAQALMHWFDHDVARTFRDRRTFDAEGIFIGGSNLAGFRSRALRRPSRKRM